MQTQFTLLARASALARAMALCAASTGALAQDAKPAGPAAAPAKPADPARVVARVNGQPITEADLAVAAEDPALSIPGANETQKRDILIGYVADLKLGAKAAEDAKLGSAPEFTRRLTYMREKLLVDEYLDAQVKKAITPDAVRKLYDETSKEMKPEDEVRARHILVESEDDAKKAATRVKGGEDFAKIAAELSKDPGSKTDGGELGFFTKDRMVAPFAEAAFKMKPNEISDPVQSQFGWHVIQVEEKRTKPTPSFDEMKDQIEQYLTRRAQQDAVLALRATGKVEKLDEKGNVIPPADKAAAPGATAPGVAAPATAAPK
jgi:peptidyl-prolyl cis-trans isomerase C